MQTAYQNEIVNPAESTTYDAKIGLMYVSDYGYAASPEAWTLNMSGYDNSTATNNIDTTNTVAGGSSNTVSNSNTLSGTNAETNANVQSVNNINDVNTSTLEINQILNIFLIAIGLILVLLAIAILIILRRWNLIKTPYMLALVYSNFYLI